MNLRSYLRGAGLGILITAIILIFGGGNRTKAMTDAEVMARARELGMSDGNETLTEAYTVATAPEPAAVEKPSEEITVSEPAVPDEPLKEVTVSRPAVAEEPSEEITVSEPAVAEEPSEEVNVSRPAAPEEPSEEVTASRPAEPEEAEEKTAEEIIEESIRDKQTTELKSDVTGENKTKSELLADAAETEAESQSAVTETQNGFISVHVNAGSSSTAVANELEKAGAVSSASAFDGFLCANGYDRRLSTGDFRIPAGASDEEIARILMRR